MTAAKGELAAYRPGIGIKLLSRDGLAFVGHRIRMPPSLPKWQMPQGGINTGETPCNAALRELKEEIGTDRAEILAESRVWIDHDVPDEIAQGITGGRYRGNRQKWFAMRFTGTDATSTSPPSIRNSTPGNGQPRAVARVGRSIHEEALCRLSRRVPYGLVKIRFIVE
jgi:putative (di)nucleoside polyphosphate hydrolase